ncbi:MAG: UDP-N-acetylmuramoyl-L-alanine--D-glutamate ligase [Chitinophagales bacterium]
MKRITILGAAESGIGAAVLAQKRGYEVFVSDKRMIKVEFKKVLEENKITFEENQHSENEILRGEEVIKSPGIPEKAPIIKLIRNRSIPIISEIEFASRYTTSPIIAITGTNGKSTTTSLTHHIFQKAGLDAALVGNIGKSFAKQIAERDASYYVAEISSFQLDDCYEFKPHVAVITNLSDNHLDRYDYNFSAYADAKFRITQKQTTDDYFIYCYDDSATQDALKRHSFQSQKISFSQTTTLGQGAFLDGDQIIFSSPKQTFSMAVTQLGLRGKHNVYNSMAAGIVANLFDIKKEVIREALADFEALEHRLEWVSDIKGVEFINDSKATTVNAVWYALESMSKPVIWIAGGIDKGNDYSVIQDLVKKKVKALICLGAENRKLHEAFSNSIDLIANTDNMNDAVKTAFHFAASGDCVLLSPACASFDLFVNFEDRGRKFKEAVRSL